MLNLEQQPTGVTLLPDDAGGSSTTFSDRALCYYLMRVEDYPQIIALAKKRFARSLCSTNGDYPRDPDPDPDKEIIDRFFDKLKQLSMPEKQPGFERLQLPSATGYAEPLSHAGILANIAANSSQAELALELMAPSFLLQPCWLQNIAYADRAHLNECAQLFQIYARAVRADSGSAVIRKQLETFPKQQRRSIADLFGIDAFLQSEIPDWAYSPPATYLSLSFFAMTYLPETLGFTLAFTFIPGLDTHLALTEQQDNVDRVSAIDAITSYCQKKDTDSSWKRIRSGFDLYLSLHNRLRINIGNQVNRKQTPRQQVISILKEKAPFAAGHHHSAKVGGKLLADWFSADVFDADGFLDELLKSGYLNSQRPKDSRLLTELTSFEGPMFGVFTKGEIEIIIHWLEGSKWSNPCLRQRQHEKPTLASPEPCFPALVAEQKPQVRALFFKLLNLESYPEIQPTAKNLVKKIVLRSNRSLLFGPPNKMGRFTYTPRSFEKHIEYLYLQEMSRHQKFEPPPKFGKAIYRWGIFQLAPTVLVDGCWLQRIATVDHWANPIHQKLFSIFADEIGDGSIHRNHPNVYRKLLTSLDIKLPEANSREFAFHADFLDAAFDIPVYLLAISQFPKAFLPEIIGLNLAIELSGLGATYQGLINEMDYWGIDSHIARLHQSIDNLASGHSAIAKQVVMLYLDQVASQYGQDAMNRHWKRIGAGYASLGVVPRRLKRNLLRAYCTEFKIPGYFHSVRSFLSRSLLGNNA